MSEVPVRVLIHVQHLLGIGHLRRAAALARALAAQGAEVLFVEGGPPVDNIDVANARVLRLPPVRAADARFSALVDVRGRPVTDDLIADRRDRLLAAAREFRPEAVLVEHFPFGRRRLAVELDALFELARGRGAVIAGSVRDVLVAKADPAKAERAARSVRRWYDRLYVHGDPALIPFGATFPFVRDIEDLVTYTGYVAEAPAANPAAPREPGGEIVVSVGGGAVGERLLTAAAVAATAPGLTAHRWRLLGPSPSDLTPLPPNVTLEKPRKDFQALLAAASLSVSQAGYNTVMDILTARCRALVVPFAEGGESEQMVRARALEAKGILSVLEEDGLTAATLASAVAAALGRPPPPYLEVRRDGAAFTARDLIALARARGPR